jgi:hypothetical protein
VRIADTLSLEHLEVSESWREAVSSRPDLAELEEPSDMRFDAAGNLAALR